MKERELPLTALRAFAVAARSETLAAAAAQLGVTVGAVSKQIAALETWLGQNLFVRQGRTQALTPYGEILAKRIDGSIRELGEACDYVRRRRAQRVIKVEAPATFAMYFLLPRLSAFETQHENVSVWISTRMTGQAPDFAGNDVVISRGEVGKARSNASSVTLLFEEELTVVSSRSLLRQRPIRRAADVLGHRLIASATRPEDWDAWLAKAGLEGPLVEGGHRFDHLFVALHAVRDGVGSTIAPSLFVAGANDRHRLQRPLPDITVSGQSYFAYATQRSDSSVVQRFMSWLCQECGPA